MASIRWVRPDFTASAYSSALRVSASASTPIAWSRGPAASTAATWMALGKVSFEDWLALTTSFGWHSTPARSASDEITSFTFMLVLVPDPVWKTSIGKCSSCRPSTISSTAATMASRCSGETTPRSAFVRAAAALTRARAWTSDAGSGRPLIGKFCTARWVCARHRASAGTSTSPMESCSVRTPCRWRAFGGRSLMLPTLPGGGHGQGRRAAYSQ